MQVLQTSCSCFSRYPSLDKPWTLWVAVMLVVFTILGMMVPSAGVLASERQELSDDERYTLLTAPIELGDEGGSETADERGEIFIRRFQTLWSDEEYYEGLVDASDEEISFRLRAVWEIVFHRRPEWVLQRFESVLNEAHARGIAERKHYRSLFEAYAANFQFKAAANLHQRYPNTKLPEVPEMVAPYGDVPSDSLIVWRVLSDPLSIERQVIDLQGSKLIVVSSWGCGISRHAANELARDDVLRSIMREHSIWVTLPSLNNTYSGVAWWNEEYPELPTYLVDDPEQWPITDFSVTPQFYFIRDGEVQELISGWRGGSKGRWDFAEGFAILGLLDLETLPEDAFADADQRSGSETCEWRRPALERIRAQVPISSREQLEEHLADVAETRDSPLFSLGDQARARLLNSLQFTEQGDVRFRTDDLRAYLGPEEIYALSALFGRQYFMAGSFFPIELLSQEERDLRDRVYCAGEYEAIIQEEGQAAQG